MTNTEIKKIMDATKFRILVDTREKKNNHIIEFFKKNGIPYRCEKLDFGDYSFEIRYNDLIYTYKEKFAVERKANLTELSGNLTQNRDRFIREFDRAKEKKAQLILLIENAEYKDIVQMNYSTNFKSKAFTASLFSLFFEYDVPFQFINNQYSGEYIYKSCYYFYRNRVKLKSK